MNTKKAALTVLSIALKIVIIAVLAVVLLRVGTVAYEYGHAIFEEERPWMSHQEGRSGLR